MKPSSQIQKSEHLKLQQVPTTLNITSISGQKDFEIELLGKNINFFLNKFYFFFIYRKFIM